MGVLNMNEDFVPFFLAKKLNEKGYTLDTTHYYDDNGGIVVSLVEFDERCVYPCPKIHQVLKWLREEKKILVVAAPAFSYKESRYFWQCGIYEISLLPNIIPFHKFIDNQVSFNSAILTGIEYVIDNLI